MLTLAFAAILLFVATVTGQGVTTVQLPNNATTARGTTLKLQVDLPSGTTHGFWLKNGGQYVFPSGRFNYSVSDPIHQLTITNVEDSDEGTYQYFAGGRSSAISYVTVVASVINGGWGEWSQWSSTSCSVTCGGGSRTATRTRSCNSPAPMYGGSNCTGNSVDTTNQICNTQSCVGGPVTNPNELRSNPIATIGSTITLLVTMTTSLPKGSWFSKNNFIQDTERTRYSVNGLIHGLTITNVQSSDAGLYRYFSNAGLTEGTLFVVAEPTVSGLCQDAVRRNGVGYRYHPSDCDKYIQCYYNGSSLKLALDGVWQTWSPWVQNGLCNVTCGGGYQPYTRSRLCTQPQFSGQPCQGSGSDATTRVCKTNNCPTDGFWREWSPWVPNGQCNVTCGGGYQPYTRSRLCIQPEFGGQPCQGSANDATTRVCNTNDCPIDGVWRDWSPWAQNGQCNATCGGGYQPYIRSRTCDQSQFGGQPCQGNSDQVINRGCNVNRCPIDGEWREWSQWFPTGQCSVTCRGGNQPFSRSRVCIQPQFGGQPCQGSANVVTTRVCNTNNCPVNGEWREWTPWVPFGLCNVTCGGGYQSYTRSRVCIQPEFGGQPCQGSANDATTRVCNTNNCPKTYILPT